MYMLTTNDAATRLHVSRSRVLKLIASGRLEATKHGRDWIVQPAALDSVRNRRPGWRKGRKRR